MPSTTDNFDKVNEADRKELAAFAHFKTCIARGRQDIESTNVIDCVWVRRWKATKLPDGSTRWDVKSRLCGRGFLDKQKFDIDKHSSTATRVSQRMALSFAVQSSFDVESWDISNAFLQGMTFEELGAKARSLGFEAKVHRRIYAKAPANVWRHFREMQVVMLTAPPGQEHKFVLEFVKPAYGLVDAPLLWQLSLLDFLRNSLKGT